jgi:LruC domain-containing protein
MGSKINLHTFTTIIICLFILISSCNRNETENIQVENFESLIIDDNFDWSTENSIQFNIYSGQSQVITISSINGDIIYHKGYYNQSTDYYNITIATPNHINQVLINGIPTELSKPITTINLNNSNTYQKSITDFPFTIPDNCIAYWDFNEDQGNVASDIYGNNHGIISGAEWVDGINGSALNYNNEGGETKIPHSEALDITSNQISHSLWFKLDQVGDDGCFLFNRVKYIIRIDKFGKLTFGLYNPTWSHAGIGWKDRIIDTDWHHLVTTYNGSKMKVYLDGKLMDTENTNGNINNSGSDIHIGTQSDLNFFDGTIDEVSIYNRALSESEVLLLFKETPNTNTGNNDLISEWLFEDINNQMAYDTYGNNDLTINGASITSGVTGNSLSFDGLNDYATAANNTDLNPLQEVSIMAWVKTQENKTAKIAQKGDWDGHGIHQDKWKGWSGHIRTADNKTHSLHWNNGVPMKDEWYHLCVTFDGAIMKLYVNGQLKNSKEVTGNLKVNGRSFSVGSDNGSQKFFNGTIDDVRFYGKSISQTAIQTIFNDQNTAEDVDGDGIADTDDEYPNDPGRAFNNYYPAAGYASIAFEDLWPEQGDYDFNDLVIDYRFTLITNANNKVSGINASYLVRAIGAGFTNGFGFQLENSNITPDDLEATGFIISEDYIELNQQGTEKNQDKITFIVFDNAKSVLQPFSGFGVNVDPQEPYVQPDTLNLHIEFSNLNYSLEDINISKFNPFLIIDMTREKEVHLPGFKPTSLANQSLFGTASDNTTPSLGIYYKTEDNLPWALRISESYEYTNEKAKILDAYLHFGDWAQSSGFEYPDWHLDKSGYRNNELIYPIPGNK